MVLKIINANELNSVGLSKGELKLYKYVYMEIKRSRMKIY